MINKKNRRKFDNLIAEKVYQKCEKKGITRYTEIALIINTTDSFVRSVYSQRRKFNFYHLVKLAYHLNCTIDDFLPTMEDYEKNSITGSTAQECCLLLINEEE